MSYCFAVDQPPDLGYFTPMLLESMYQILSLTVLKLGQTPREPDFEDECPPWASDSPMDSIS